jgi:hypothetical protein
MGHLITLNPGYPSEQTVDPQQLQIHDLWGLYMALKDGKLTRSRTVQAEIAERVLETWHLAHALKEYIRKEAARMPSGPPLSICGECLLSGFVSVGDAFVVTTPEDCQRHAVEV